MKFATVVLLCFACYGCVETSEAKVQSKSKDTASQAMKQSIFDGLRLPTLDGKTLREKELDGQVVLVVNVASQCGYTRQYEGLQALYERYSGQGFTILGVPCNQFGRQEPGSAQDILQFTKERYGVSFPLLVKQDVNGKERSELLSRLMNQSVDGRDVRWNFEKFLIGRDGRVVARYGSGTEPESRQLLAAIEQAIAAKQ